MWSRPTARRSRCGTRTTVRRTPSKVRRPPSKVHVCVCARACRTIALVPRVRSSCLSNISDSIHNGCTPKGVRARALAAAALGSVRAVSVASQFGFIHHHCTWLFGCESLLAAQARVLVPLLQGSARTTASPSSASGTRTLSVTRLPRTVLPSIVTVCVKKYGQYSLQNGRYDLFFPRFGDRHHQLGDDGAYAIASLLEMSRSPLSSITLGYNQIGNYVSAMLRLRAVRCAMCGGYETDAKVGGGQIRMNSM